MTHAAQSEVRDGPGRNPAKFPAALRFLHWSMAVLLIGLFALGLYIHEIPLEDPGKWTLYPWHRAFGVVAFLLVISRLVTRLSSRIPELPKSISWYERRGAQIAQLLLYVGMLVVPLAGYVASSALPELPGIPPLNTIWFFGVELPLAPVAKNYDTTKIFITIHKYAAYGMAAIVAAHVVGALKHRYFDKPEHDVLSKMI
ncbi:MAG: cytochrome b [Methyloligellaceae bacterium]